MTQEAENTSIHSMAAEIFNLSTLAWRERLRARRGADGELSEAQFLTLETLMQGPGILTVGDILRSICVAPAQMSRIIRGLEEDFAEPLIACELNRNDRRKIDVSMTDAGRKLYAEFRDSRLARTIEILSGLPETDRQDFVRVCGKIRQLYSR